MHSLRRYRRALLVALHVLLIPLAYRLAFELRFDFDVPVKELRAFWLTLPMLLLVRLVTFAAFRVHRGWWRHVGMYDLEALFKAISTGSALFIAGLLLSSQMGAVPRSIVVLEWGTALTAFGGIRFAARWVREGRTSRPRRRSGGRRALVVGAGDTAAGLLHQIRQEPDVALLPIGLVDDDPSKRSLRIHGVPVLGTTADLPRLVAKHRIQLLVVALPAATREQMQRIAERCTGLNVELKVVPDLGALLDGTAKVSELRAVRVEEVLGRVPVTLGVERIEENLRGRVVLITGAAGSIGSEVARQVAHFGAEGLLLLDQAESPLFYIHREILASYPSLRVVPLIGDITDRARMETIFARYLPDHVVHAAAYKHVPMMEANATEAIRNNVFGTLIVARCAARYGAAKFVMISTDKAVRPSSIMGASKRAAERMVLGLPELQYSLTDFRAVRFGNVLGSDGSVIPIFRKQIAEGGPVTVTDARATRYFMTIPEAVQLVLEAAALPEAAGRIAMLDMGKPMRILELAENLIRFSGLEPYTQVPIVFTGLRPGEKLHEELLADVESTAPTPVDKIRLVTRLETEPEELQASLERLAASLAVGNEADQLASLLALVPEAASTLTLTRKAGAWPAGAIRPPAGTDATAVR